MQSQRIKILVVAIVAAMIAVSICSAQSAKPSADAVQLVRQLATNSNSPYDEKLEKSIVELGDEALPALKNELRLGIRFKELNELLKQEKSRRYAVVRVLARIPGAESTKALVECLSDPPDNYAMRVAALRALSKRTLSTAQIQAMLGNHEPEIVLAGIDHAAGKKTAEPELKVALERVFDTKVATAQFKNEYGASTAGPDALWDVRLAAGKALGIDLTAEKKEKVEQILAELQQEALHPTKPEDPVWTSYASRSENIVCRDLNKLAALGPPAKELVEAAAAGADGDYAKILDMARAQLGDRTRVAAVADSLVSADSHTVRFCAAMTLRRIGDRSAIPALRKATSRSVSPPRRVGCWSATTDFSRETSCSRRTD